MNFLLAFLLFLAVGFAAAWTAERARRQRTEAAHLREIDEQRTHREIELRAQTERTVALFDRMIEGLIVIDAGGRIRLANRAAGELFGFPSPAIGRTILGRRGIMKSRLSLPGWTVNPRFLATN